MVVRAQQPRPSQGARVPTVEGAGEGQRRQSGSSNFQAFKHTVFFGQAQPARRGAAPSPVRPSRSLPCLHNQHLHHANPLHLPKVLVMPCHARSPTLPTRHSC